MYKLNKLTLLLLIIIVGKSNGYCQEKFTEPATYKVSYKFSFAFDTTDISKHYTEEMSLYTGAKYSVFRNARYEVYEEQIEKLKRQVMDKRISGNVTGFSSTIPSTEVFRNIVTNTIYKKEVLAGRDYVIQDKLDPIKWAIEPEVKMLGDIRCQKARGSFRGRNYIVWFAPSIPVSTGPWKLGGLPGLILQAADQTQEVVFTFVGLQRLDKSPVTTISLPQQYVKISTKDFEKLRNAYLDDPGAFIANRNVTNGITVNVNGIENRSGSQKKKSAKSPMNNALELTKN
ncbi:MAG: GLPGLI family protein [Sediminibacterium sp.]